MIPLSALWSCDDAEAWETALERYWAFVQPRNMALERQLEQPQLERIREFSPSEWYAFLHDEYFRWKYTAPNRYATTTTHLRRYISEGKLAELDNVRKRLISLREGDVEDGLVAASSIRGLGIAGASGLLALMYPATFGTVDQFVVKALREVEILPERHFIAAMNPISLKTLDALLLIRVMQQQADKLNRSSGSRAWTPRKVDKVLWTYGR
jgi:hypothetical protein